MDEGNENDNINQHKESINKILKTIREAKTKKVDPWVWAPFNNPAREDTTKLSHWSKKTEKDDIYSFSKLNRKIDVIRYTPEEYHIIQKLPQDSRKHKWSKSDTDLLYDLCVQFQLRFINITDRFNFEKCVQLQKKEEHKLVQLQGVKRRDRKCKEKEAKTKFMKRISKEKEQLTAAERTVEEIKDRYYEITRAILLARGQKDHVIVQTPYDYFLEKKRKENVEKLFLRSKQDNELEKQLLADFKKIDQLIKKTEKEEKQLEKLIQNEKLRQDAVMQQQELITKKIEESKQKIKDQQEQKKTKTDDSASYLVSEKIY